MCKFFIENFEEEMELENKVLLIKKIFSVIFFSIKNLIKFLDFRIIIIYKCFICKVIWLIMLVIYIDKKLFIIFKDIFLLMLCS